MKPHNLPKTPEDVKPEDNEFIATEILKLKRKMEIWTERHPLTGKKTQYSDDRWILPNGDMYGSKALNFYTNTQHSKMLDSWSFNNLRISIRIQRHYETNKKEYVVDVQFKNVLKRPIRVVSQSEAFARTSSVVKAWMEINKK